MKTINPLFLNKTLQLFSEYFDEEDYVNIEKVSIKYNEIIWIKRLFIKNYNLHKVYFLKITLKDKTVKLFHIPYYKKEELKNKVTLFNMYLSNL